MAQIQVIYDAYKFSKFVAFSEFKFKWQSTKICAVWVKETSDRIKAGVGFFFDQYSSNGQNEILISYEMDLLIFLHCVFDNWELKVSKSQRQFFLKLHCQKMNEILDKILPYGVSRKIAFEIYWPLVIRSQLTTKERSVKYDTQRTSKRTTTHWRQKSWALDPRRRKVQKSGGGHH